MKHTARRVLVGSPVAVGNGNPEKGPRSCCGSQQRTTARLIGAVLADLYGE